jgi:hypothetical protein
MVSGSADRNPWTLVSDQLFRETGRYRIPKQIRGRWYNYLDPKINKDQWTAKQDLELISQVKLSGKKWALISKNIPGRNENMVKNRYHSLLRTMKDLQISTDIKKQYPQTESIEQIKLFALYERLTQTNTA